MSATESPAEILARLQLERQVVRAPAPPPAVPLAVTGSRNLTPSEAQLLAFWALFDRLGGTELHHGDCRGVDRAVAADARRRRPDLPVIAHPAEWDLHGKAAGPIRNEDMARICQAAVAFPGHVGTAGCIRAFHRLGKKVLFVQDEVERVLAELRDSVEHDHLDLGLWPDS